jgi:hypothetical protein
MRQRSKFSLGLLSILGRLYRVEVFSKRFLFFVEVGMDVIVLLYEL